MSNEIIFYDACIQSSVRANKCYAPNTLPVRYALNYKKLPYKTVWIEYHEIEPVAKKLGAKATKTKPNGDPWYTVPFIHDTSTGVVMSESSDIVRYLDEQYPSSPRVITPGTLAFETAYYRYFQAGVWSNWPKPVHQYLYETVSPESAAFIKRLREEAFGNTLVNLAKNPQSHWDGYKNAFTSVVLPIYEKAEGVFLKGDEPSWADFVTASALLSIKLLYGAGSKEWEYIETWDGGRWAKLIKDLEPYGYIDE